MRKFLDSQHRRDETRSFCPSHQPRNEPGSLE